MGWVPLWMPGGELALLWLGLPCRVPGMCLAINRGWSDLFRTRGPSCSDAFQDCPEGFPGILICPEIAQRNLAWRAAGKWLTAPSRVGSRTGMVPGALFQPLPLAHI